MKVLIIGSGGREHALAWKIAQSSRVGQIFVAPGNAGTRLEPNTTNVDIAADNVAGLLAFAQREHIDLTIVGPEGPLVLGICDDFAAAGLRCFGPSRLAARLEGSKAYAKDFLRRHGIPTAAYATFTRETFDPPGSVTSRRRSSSRQTALLPARVSSSARRRTRPSRPLGPPQHALAQPLAG